MIEAGDILILGVVLGVVLLGMLSFAAYAYVQRPSWFPILPELSRPKRMAAFWTLVGCQMVLSAAFQLLTGQDHASGLRIFYFIVAVQGGAMIGFAIRELDPRFRNEREEA